jgi:hypothetical protein
VCVPDFAYISGVDEKLHDILRQVYVLSKFSLYLFRHV